MASTTLAQLIRNTQGVRSSYQEVVAFCTQYLAWHPSTDDSWRARELLVKALLDQGDLARAGELVKELEAKFGLQSQRVAVLRGMVLEAQGETSRALAVYMDLLQKNRNNSLAAKRVLALKRSMGDSPVHALNLLLQDNQSDLEVWLELMDVELVRGAFDEAVFCAEEVLLGNPHSHHVLCLYGELLLSASAQQNALEARQYFSQALVIHPHSARSAWGLLVASSESSDELAKPLGDKAKQLLLQIYAKSPLLDLVQPALQRL